jgi:predicted TIM-barrel fold metal-dependent hydrolase
MTDRYLVVSADSHVGPSMRRQLRPYCERRHLDAFDEDLRRTETHLSNAARQVLGASDPLGGAIQGGQTVASTKLGSAADSAEMRARRLQAETAEGLQDPVARLRHMDEEGVAADVIFAGGQNDELLPFDTSGDPDLQRIGYEIFNRWMCDYVSIAPERLIGVAQITLDDIGDAIAQVERAKEQGFRTINFPAPRRGLLPYTEPAYEPFWRVCAEANMTLNTHGGGGDRGYWSGPGARFCARAEGQFFGRRALWALIFGGVFERHPNLTFVLTEQMAGWVPQTLSHLDGIYRDNLGQFTEFARELPHSPSEYWRRQVYIANSFMSRTEAGLRHEIGVDRMMYGTDYPHTESVWPLTRLALRQALAEVPAEEVAAIVGGNAIRCFQLDEAALRAIADRIGPTVSEIDVPPTEAELATVPPGCFAFRDW